MKEIASNNTCTGCTACANSCPQKAIKMKYNTEGFLYPIIDEKKCINCGLCKKVCPVLNSKKNSSINECYCGYARDEKIVMNSSSGGLFYLLADNVLQDNGVVIGAAFIKSNTLNHIIVEEKKDLRKLMGSKYLQSNMNDIFNYVKKTVNKRKVLFAGTPCQVAGLKSFLKKEYDNLITIDLICHGTPSQKLFEKYVEYLEKKNNDKLINYNFRDKSTGWNTYSNSAKFKNKEIKELSRDNYYMNLFLSDNSLRESCYNCKFKLGNKYSDITLGDFWGINKYYPKMYNKKGTSAIIINTTKGKSIFDNIQKLIIYEQCKLEEIEANNPSLKNASKRSSKRTTFYKDLEKLCFEKQYKKYNAKKTSISKKMINRIKRLINSEK